MNHSCQYNTFLYLTRHGETESSAVGLYYGRSESMTTATGKMQIERLSLRLKDIDVAAIYASPLERCLETARLIGSYHSIKPDVLKELIEIDYGDWDGLSREQIAEKYPEIYSSWQKDPASNRIPNGESGYDVASRVMPRIFQLIRKHIGQTVVAVSHNTVNRIIMCHFLGLPIEEYRSSVVQLPASINVIAFSESLSYVVLTMNDVSHWALKKSRNIQT